MNERQRYIALATKFHEMTSQIAKCIRDEIAGKVERGVKIEDSIQEIAHALEQIPRLVETMIQSAQRGHAIDINALQAARDHYVATMRGMVNAIRASLWVN